MNKVRVLAVAGLTSIAFAGGDLWDFTTLLETSNCGNFCSQVHTPGAIYCWANAPEPGPNSVDDDGNPSPYFSTCYKRSGGWWFGYADNNGAVKDAVSDKNVFNTDSCPTPPKDPNPTQSLGTIAVEKYIDASQNGDWKSLTAKTFDKNGHYLVKEYGMGNATDGLDVKFINPAGTDEEPTVSAIGFNWRQKQECNYQDYENRFAEDLSGKEGLCIRYKADGAGVDVELGWNEKAYGYDTWIVKLPVANDWKTMDMKWEDFAPSYESEADFQELDIALTKAEALKFALKNRGASAVTIRFQLKEVGWLGSCSGTAERPPAPTPIMGGKMASAYKFNVNGRTLSANFAGSVQVINLQGAVVAKKTLAAEEPMNLANLPVGIYMVRSEKLGIVQKIMVK
jgi:hypothetical protein